MYAIRSYYAELLAVFIDMAQQIVITKPAEHFARGKSRDAFRAAVPECDAPVFVYKIDAFVEIVEQVFAIAEFVIHCIPFSYNFV